MAIACQSGIEHVLSLLLYARFLHCNSVSGYIWPEQRAGCSSAPLIAFNIGRILGRLPRLQSAGLASAAHDKACCAGLELLVGILNMARPGSTGK